MPLIKIDLLEGRLENEIKNIMDTVQDCSVE